LNIRDFAVRVAELEGKKISLSIAQIMEVLKIVNNLIGGLLYMWIRKL